MIYFESLDSLIESIYLEDSLKLKMTESNVFVNPDKTQYIVGKTVIINSYSYPGEKILELLENNNTVISRLYNEDIQNDNFIISPYILRICPKIMWSGKYADTQEDILERELYEYDIETGILYFPKILGEAPLVDDCGNLSGLGWVQQQVGMNVKKGAIFENLDLIKTGKIKEG